MSVSPVAQSTQGRGSTRPSFCPAAAQAQLCACTANRSRESIWLEKSMLKHPPKSNMFFFPAGIASPICRAHSYTNSCGGSGRHRGEREREREAPPGNGSGAAGTQPGGVRCPAPLPHRAGSEQGPQRRPGCPWQGTAALTQGASRATRIGLHL